MVETIIESESILNLFSEIDFGAMFNFDPMEKPDDSKLNSTGSQSEVNLVIPSGEAKCSCYDMLISEDDECNGLCDCPSCEDESFQKCIQVGKEIKTFLEPLGGLSNWYAIILNSRLAISSLYVEFENQ